MTLGLHSNPFSSKLIIWDCIHTGSFWQISDNGFLNTLDSFSFAKYVSFQVSLVIITGYPSAKTDQQDVVFTMQAFPKVAHIIGSEDHIERSTLRAPHD